MSSSAGGPYPRWIGKAIRSWPVLLVALAGCDLVFRTDAAYVPPGVNVDATVDTPAPVAGLLFADIAPFAATVNTSGEEDRPSLTADQLEMYFHRANDIYVTRRDALDAPWSEAVKVPNVSTPSAEIHACITGDGLTLYFTRSANLFVATRDAKTAPWSSGAVLPNEINESGTERCGYASDNGLELYFDTNVYAGGERDIVHATRLAPNLAWAAGRDALDDPDADDTAPWRDAAGASYVFATRRGGTPFRMVEYVVEQGTFIEHPELGEAGTPWLSPDGRTIYFSRVNGMQTDLFVATR